MFGAVQVAAPRNAALDAVEFVTKLQLEAGDLDQLARNLGEFPESVRSRGVFVLGLTRLIGARKGRQTADEALCHAGISSRVVAFKSYPHRDFYKLYYLATRLLAPHRPFDEGLCDVARTFFPIFRESILGKTISALMGERAGDVLPLLSKAYNMSVEGNDHALELMTCKREAVWRARVEPVAWYQRTFEGIVRGALPEERELQILLDAQKRVGELIEYAFRIRW